MLDNLATLTHRGAPASWSRVRGVAEIFPPLYPPAFSSQTAFPAFPFHPPRGFLRAPASVAADASTADLFKRLLREELQRENGRRRALPLPLIGRLNERIAGDRRSDRRCPKCRPS